jgi:hypothetical protein
VVDPNVPSLTVWRLEDGQYGDPVHVEGAETIRLQHPFAVDVCPSDLTA